MKTSKWMHLNAGTNATPAIPGDGIGSFKELQGTAKNITAIVNATTVTLNALTSMAIGDLAVTTDGFFGTIVGLGAGSGLGATDMQVREWRNKDAGKLDTPALGTANLNFFDTGSCIAHMQTVILDRLIIPAVANAAATVSVLDYRMATATPILTVATTHDTGQGLGVWELGLRVSAPFALQISVVANADAMLIFTPES